MRWIAVTQDDGRWRVLDLDDMPADGPTHIVARDLTEKDAHIIAAAPDLLAAAEFVVSDTPVPGEDAELTPEGYNRLCAAIVKSDSKETPCD